MFQYEIKAIIIISNNILIRVSDTYVNIVNTSPQIFDNTIVYCTDMCTTALGKEQA